MVGGAAGRNGGAGTDAVYQPPDDSPQSSFATTTSNSCREAISSRAVSIRQVNWASVSVPRVRRRRTSSSNVGGARKTVTASASPP